MRAPTTPSSCASSWTTRRSAAPGSPRISSGRRSSLTAVSAPTSPARSSWLMAATARFDIGAHALTDVPTAAFDGRSLRHDMICAYHLAPAPDFVLDEGGRFGRRAAVRLDIERAKALLHVGQLEHLDGGLGDLILQLRPELGRCDHGVPDAREPAGKPHLGVGRPLRHRRGASLVGHRQDLELALAIKSERPRHVAEENIDALPEHVVV